MNFLKIVYLYFFGYINIDVEGFFIERFINICISKKIFLWRLSRINSTKLRARIGISDFKKIHNIARKTKCKVSIDSKKGLPFLLHKYKKRKIFAITLFVIAILIFGLTRFVWNIEIICSEKINKNEIIEILNSKGIKEGVPIRKINTEKAINEICLKEDAISWVGIKIAGTNVIVNIVEATEKPEIIDKNEICNIVSDKEAIIEKISVQDGTARANKGDTVKPGDLLVEGIIEGKYTGNRYVHSEATIIAKVWYTKEKEKSLIQKNDVLTGAQKETFGININKFKINFNKTLPKFKKYDTIETKKKLKLFSNFYIPIEIEKVIYKEKITETKKYTIEELSDELQNELKMELLKENNITEEDLIEVIPTISPTQDGVRVKLTCITEEEIGVPEQLVY